MSTAIIETLLNAPRSSRSEEPPRPPERVGAFRPVLDRALGGPTPPRSEIDNRPTPPDDDVEPEVAAAATNQVADDVVDVEAAADDAPPVVEPANQDEEQDTAAEFAIPAAAVAPTQPPVSVADEVRNEADAIPASTIVPPELPADAGADLATKSQKRLREIGDVPAGNLPQGSKETATSDESPISPIGVVEEHALDAKTDNESEFASTDQSVDPTEPVAAATKDESSAGAGVVFANTGDVLNIATPADDAASNEFGNVPIAAAPDAPETPDRGAADEIQLETTIAPPPELDHRASTPDEADLSERGDSATSVRDAAGDAPSAARLRANSPDPAERPSHAAPSLGGNAVDGVDRARFLGRVEGAIRSAQQRDGRVHVRLSPPELGALRIELTMQHGVLSAHVEAETAAARNLLLDNLPALRDRLAQQDVRVERFDVDVRRDGGESAHQGGADDRPAPDDYGRRHHQRQERIARPAVRPAEAPAGSSAPASAPGLDVRV